MASKTNAQEVLRTHKITLKKNKRSNGKVQYYYSIQFTYPKGKKQQFTGVTEEEVRQKVFHYFNISYMTLRELFEKWQEDPDPNEVRRKKIGNVKYVIRRILDDIGDMKAAELKEEDIIEAGKRLLASGLKTQTANLSILGFRHLYEYGIEKGYLDINPAAGVKYFKRQELEFEREYLSDRQIYEFLTYCKNDQNYIYAAFLICGISFERFVPLRWKDIYFEEKRISITRKMADRLSFEIIELERTERTRPEEPQMAFDFLMLELEAQAQALGISRDALRRSGRFIAANKKIGTNMSVNSFTAGFNHYLRDALGVDYRATGVLFTSGVYAFKAECDLPSVASIVGYPKAVKMFRNPEKYDLFERKKTRSVNDYFDSLFFGSIQPAQSH